MRIEGDGGVPARPRRPPVMSDVGRLAGVSHQTVSRVLNDHPNVREQTRLRVQAAINELGYRPNKAARLLVTGTSQVIGVETGAPGMGRNEYAEAMVRSRQFWL